MNTAYTYLNTEGVSVDEIMDYISLNCPSYMFTGDKKVEEVTITLPDNTTYPYTYFEFPSYKVIENLYNVELGKITDYDDCTITVPVTTSTSTTLTGELENVIGAKYGMGYIFENLDESTDIVIRYSYVDKSWEYLNKDIYNSIVNALYYLYLKQPNEVYNYMQVLSLDKQNILAENKKTAKNTRVYRGTLKACEF